MNTLNAPDGGSQLLTLPAALILREASPLAAQLLEARGRNLVIDASKVEKVGTQCLQVLLSAHSTWARDNFAFGLSQPSVAFLDALQTLGIPVEKIGEREPTR